MATQAQTQHKQDPTGTPTLLLAVELGVSTWRLGFTTGAAQRPRERQVPAGAIHTGLVEIGRAKQRCGLPADTRVVSCYEAGRDVAWCHRFLAARGVETLGVDSASLRCCREQRHVSRQR